MKYNKQGTIIIDKYPNQNPNKNSNFYPSDKNNKTNSSPFSINNSIKIINNRNQNYTKLNSFSCLNKNDLKINKKFDYTLNEIKTNKNNENSSVYHHHKKTFSSFDIYKNNGFFENGFKSQRIINENISHEERIKSIFENLRKKEKSNTSYFNIFDNKNNSSFE